ncbi:MAG: bifunctional phosphopantothenoylcysteine decarboxylase/phosphopantothenate--cysteine ligase CoaBC [Candidatus Margulisiibacteriota bacterium]
MSPRILLGISGSIAAVKTPELIRLLRKKQWDITPLLTDAALQFVTPTALHTLAETAPITTTHSFEHPMAHLSVGREAAMMVVAPATANCLAKFAHGLADDVLSSTFLAFQGPKLVVPAMHSEMWTNPITQSNIAILRQHGVQVLGPDRGDLACGDTGEGRMVSPDLIALAIEVLLETDPPHTLAGQKILISAGGTKEPIDAVRLITNRGTGQLGETLAHVATVFGADVVLVSTTPPRIPNPKVQHQAVETVDDMEKALGLAFETADMLFMTAAISDFKAEPSSQKLKRQANLTLNLHGTSDILAKLGQRKKTTQTIVGFCLEDQDLKTVALQKMASKNTDFMVANHSQNIGSTHRSFTLYNKAGDTIVEGKNGSVLQTAILLLRVLSPPKKP